MIFKTQSSTMATRLVLVSVIALLSFSSHAQRQLWTVGTAYTMGKKDMRISLLQPSAYGLTKTIELSAHPVAFLATPNLNVKKQWLRKKNFAIASKHGVVYPSFLLQKLSEAEVNDDLSMSEEIPGILHFKNYLLISIGWGKNLCPSFTREEFNRKNTWVGPTKILTLKFGLETGSQFGEGEMPVLTNKYIFHHTYPYYELYLFDFGIDYDARINTFLDYTLDIDFLAMEGQHYAVEHKALLNWWAGKRFFHVAVGYQMSYGEYIDEGNQFFIGPCIDLMWTMRRNRVDLGLFGKKLF